MSSWRVVARWTVYPLLWVMLLGFFAIGLKGIFPYKATWAANVVTTITLLMISERIIPYEQRWQMTWVSFKSDMKYILTNLAFLAALNMGLALLTISTAGRFNGPAAGWTLWQQFLCCILVFEALNYTTHRLMHEAPGRLGRFLWATHLAHHLPDRVYVLMHAVFHPINAIITQAMVITLPIWWMGYDVRVVTLFLMINGLHGLISHYNVDVRMGWLNYLFVGPELHRYHHSAKVSEAFNYGATLSIFDILLGTFVYRPGVPPQKLGVAWEKRAPAYSSYFTVLALPFRRSFYR